MQANDAIREFTIGSQRFAIVRLDDGTFELEDHGFAAAPVQPVASRPATEVPWGTIFLAVAGFVVLLVAGSWYVTKRLPYASIRWKPFHPADNRFVVSFPGDPKSENESITVPPYDLQTTVLTADRKDHGYVVSYFDMPRLVREADAPRILDASLNGMLRETSSKLESSTAETISERPALRFVMRVPKGADHPEGLDEGLLVADYNRIYVIHAIRPERDSYRKDTEQFLASFQLVR